MPNQYVNKVVFGNQTLLDLTSDTVTPSVLMEGYTAHDRSGAIITGTATGGSGDGYVWQDENGYVHLSDEQGTSVTVEALSVTQNGTYTAPTGKAYSPVSVNVSGGGGDTWSWMGENPYKIYTWSDKKFLKDTAYATWTPTTTSTLLEDTTALSTLTLDLSLYEYVIVSKFHSHFEYGAGAEQKSLVHEYYAANTYSAYGKPDNLSNMTNDINTLKGANILLSTGLFYINSSSAEAYSASYNYGVYIGGSVSPSISSYNSQITPKSYKINAGCHASYFSTTNAEAVDQTASYYEQSCEVWRINKRTATVGATANYIRDMWLNGF